MLLHDELRYEKSSVSQALPSKDAVLSVLLATDADHVRGALADLADRRPDLLPIQLAAKGRGVSDPALRHSQQHAALRRASFSQHRKYFDEVKSTCTAAEKLPTVQYTSKVYFCHECDSTVTLPVVRTGDRSGTVEVRYITKPGTAQAGKNFRSTSGTLTFKPGQHMLSIIVEIIDDGNWDGTRGFMVDLLDEGLNGAVRGELWRAMVFEIDKTTFPSDRYKDVIMKDLTSPRRSSLDDQSELTKFKLLCDYIMFAWKDKVLWNRSLKVALRDQIFNLHILFTMLLSVYMIDYVINSKKDESKLWIFKSKTGSLISIGIFMICSWLPLHMMDFWRVKLWRIGGPQRAKLQSELLRRFLHFTSEVRAQIRPGEVVAVMTVDIEALINEGYDAILKLPKATGQIVVVVVFNVCAAVVFNKPISFFTVLVCGIVFPLIVFTFMLFYGPRMGRVLKDQQEKLVVVHDSIDELINEYQLINDFFKRGMYQKRFEGFLSQYNGARIKTALVVQNHQYFITWLTVIVKAFYVVVGGRSVLSSDQTLGMFVANLAVIAQIGDSWTEVARLARNIQGVFPAMNRIICMMNLATDFDEACEASVARQAKTEKYLDSVGELDDIPIIFEGLLPGFRIQSSAYCTEMNLAGTLQISQGDCVCLLGRHGSGKGILAKFMSGRLHNTLIKSSIFVPAHVRVLYVSSEPMFLFDTLQNNILLGVEDNIDSGIVRARAICKRLGLPDRIIDLLESDMVGQWTDILSCSECQLLSIARALIADMEFLVFHKPMAHLTPETKRKYMELVTEFTSLRGVEMDPRTVALRRPRTCLVSTTSEDHFLELFDKVYTVNENGVKVADNEVDRQSLDDDGEEPTISAI